MGVARLARKNEPSTRRSKGSSSMGLALWMLIGSTTIFVLRAEDGAASAAEPGTETEEEGRAEEEVPTGEEVASIPFESVPGGTAFAGGGSPITLDSEVVVAGKIRHRGLLQLGPNTPEAFEVTLDRYIVEARPEEIGTVVSLDHDIVAALCRDKDGCEIVLQMVNWDGTGNVASRTARLFLSVDSDHWRISDVDVTGVDGSASTQEWTNWDCHFSDAETSLGSSNQRSDAAPGFGLLNCLGCTYSDVTTTCRVVLID